MIRRPQWLPGEFADDHEEHHALPLGACVGLAGVSSGWLALLGLAGAIVMKALLSPRPAPADEQDVLNDVRREPHYFAAGVVLGAILGVIVRWGL